MTNFAPYRILHLELSEGIPSIVPEPNTQGCFIVFWWHQIPLGQQLMMSEQLPLPPEAVATLAVQAITPAIGDHLFSQGFNIPVCEHLIPKFKTKMPMIEEFIGLKEPLSQLDAKFSLKEPINATFSLIICTRNRTEALSRCLRSLERLSYRPLEIIVVDNAPSSDETRQLVSSLPSIRYILEPRPGLSVARNTGIKASQGEFIAFTDDDALIHPDWLLRLYQGFKTPDIMAVTGLMLPAELETESQFIFEAGVTNFIWGYRQRTFNADFFRDTRRVGAPVWRIGAGVNMAFRRQIFDKVGYFDERLGAGASGCSEDSEMWYRIVAEGYSCRYEPTAVVFHYHRRESENFQAQIYQYMRGHVTALLIQFARYQHWGNLYRLFVDLPKYYLGLLLKTVLNWNRKMAQPYLSGIWGCLAGIKYYLLSLKSQSSKQLSN